jgi:hypothetical protein
LILGMERNGTSGRAGATRRAFLSVSAATAVAVPLLSAATPAGAAALPGSEPDAGLLRLLGEIDPARIEATITRLVQFGTRHTASHLVPGPRLPRGQAHRAAREL